MAKMVRNEIEGKEYKKTRKDRKDGRFINAPAMLRIMTYFKDREEAYVYINRKFDVTDMIKYMEKKKKKNPNLTFFHAFTTAITKVVFNRPRLNNFIMNHKFYARNEVIIAFTAKVEFSDKGKEVMSLIRVNRDDTIDDIGKRIGDKVDSFRKKMEQTSSDDTLDILDKIPYCLMKWPLMPLLLWMDRHDKLPKSIYNELLYNSTAILSNLGSIKCGAIHHNLTNIGSSSIIITMGDIHKEVVVNKEGKQEIRDIVEFGINLDERIADGAYMSKAVNLLNYIMTHPETLDEPLKTKYEGKDYFTYE